MRKDVLIKSALCVMTVSVVAGSQFVPLNVKGYDSISLDSDKAIAGLDISVDNLISAGGTDLYAYEIDNIISTNVTSKETDSSVEDGEADLTQDETKADDEKAQSGEEQQTDDESKEAEQTEETAEPVSEFENVGISIANNYVNVRSESNTDSEIVGKLYRGCAATILENDIKEADGEWTKIESGNVTGYIKKEYLAIGFDVDELVDQYGTRYATVNTMTLNVRTEMNTECKILTQIPVDETYEVIKEYDEWVEISIDDDLTGYVSKEYVDMSVEFEKAISIEEEQAELKRAEEARLAQEEQERKLKEQQEAENNKKKTQVSSNTNASSSGNTSKTSGNTSSSGNTSKSSGNTSTSGSGSKTDTSTKSPTTVTSSNNSENTTSTTSSSGVTGAEVAAYAQKFVGNPYVYGGTSLTNGTDCSGFTQSIYKSFGITIPRDSRSQSVYGTKVSLSELKAGDLLFYTNSSGVVNHVAMYIGNGKVCHASNERDGIKISTYNYRTPYCARRIIN